MLEILYKDKYELYKENHVSLTCFDNIPTDIDEIIYVTADGPELEFIGNTFRQIPINEDYADYGCITWRGDFAKFIIDNWSY